MGSIGTPRQVPGDQVFEESASLTARYLPGLQTPGGGGGTPPGVHPGRYPTGWADSECWARSGSPENA